MLIQIQKPWKALYRHKKAIHRCQIFFSAQLSGTSYCQVDTAGWDPGLSLLTSIWCTCPIGRRDACTLGRAYPVYILSITPYFFIPCTLLPMLLMTSLRIQHGQPWSFIQNSEVTPNLTLVLFIQLLHPSTEHLSHILASSIAFSCPQYGEGDYCPPV